MNRPLKTYLYNFFSYTNLQYKLQVYLKLAAVLVWFVIIVLQSFQNLMHFGRNVLEITANIAYTKTDVSLHWCNDVHYMMGLKLTVSFNKLFSFQFKTLSK